MSRYMSKIYLALTVIGFFVGVYYITLVTIDQSGFDIVRFIQETSTNPSSRLLSADFAATILTIFAFMAHEGTKHKVKYWWLGIVGSFGVGVCFGLPLFLYLRARTIKNKSKEFSKSDLAL